MSFTRRTVVRAAAWSVPAISVAAQAPAFAMSTPGTDPNSVLSRPDRQFLRRGLMHGAWLQSISTANFYTPSTSLWNDSGFTTPTFYNDKPLDQPNRFLWNQELMASLPNSTWAVAKAPKAAHIPNAGVYPDPNVEWLTSAQLARVDDLFTACYGDEDDYSTAYRDYLTAAYAWMRTNHPDVLLHTNQAIGQFNDANMRSYVRASKPDLITFDYYYWMKGVTYPGGSISTLYSETGRYRRLAMEGLTGDGTQPIAFGQYTCGFKLIPGTDDTLRRYVVSGSQQKGVAFVTLAMGGKWLNMFRWEGFADGVNETDGRFMAYTDGSPTPQFTRHQQLNANMLALSPYLVRLRTQKVAVNPGVPDTGTRQTQSEVPVFDAATDSGSGVVGLSQKNNDATNGGKPGDVLLGTFRHLPNMTAIEAGNYFGGTSTAAFMIVNCLILPNNNPVGLTPTDPAPHTRTGGNEFITRQTVTVTVNPTMAGSTPAKLFRVDRANGNAVQVPLTQVGAGPTYTFSIQIFGGEGDLFFWR